MKDLTEDVMDTLVRQAPPEAPLAMPVQSLAPPPALDALRRLFRRSPRHAEL